jgi:hypothetical protein
MNGYWHGYGPTKPRAWHGRGAGPRLPLTIVNLPLQAAPARQRPRRPLRIRAAWAATGLKATVTACGLQPPGGDSSNSGLRVGHWPQPARCHSHESCSCTGGTPPPTLPLPPPRYHWHFQNRDRRDNNRLV